MYNETEKQTDRISVVCISVNQCAIEMSIVIGSSYISVSAISKVEKRLKALVPL